MARSEDTRGRILHAAEEVVLRDGVARLTIEGAASEAGISKGGVLYHFPTRDSLVSAMVERLATAFDEDLARYLAVEGPAEPARPGAFTRAYVRATFAPGGDERDERLGAAVLAGVAADPALLSELRERFEVWQRRIEDDGIPAATATLVRLAADGLWLVDLLGLAPPRSELRSAIADALLRATENAPAGVLP